MYNLSIGIVASIITSVAKNFVIDYSFRPILKNHGMDDLYNGINNLGVFGDIPVNHKTMPQLKPNNLEYTFIMDVLQANLNKTLDDLEKHGLGDKKFIDYSRVGYMKGFLDSAIDEAKETFKIKQLQLL